MTKKNAIKLICFAILTVLLLMYFYMIFNFPKGTDGDFVRERFNTFYAQEDNSIDCMFLGSSGTDRYWMPAFAWKEDGLATYELTTGVQHVVFTKYLMNEAMKNQDIEVFAIDLRTLVGDLDHLSDKHVRRITDNIRLSKNKFDVINQSIKYLKKSKNKKVDTSALSYYYRPVKYHSGWKKLELEDFTNWYPESDYMGYISHSYYYKHQPQKETEYTSDKIPFPQENKELIDDLLGYCNEVDAEVFFFSTPMSCDKERLARYNYAADYLRERGYQVIECNNKGTYSELNWNFKTDMWNVNHANILGAIKFTRFMSDILVNDYHLKDHRKDVDVEKYDDWEKGYENTLKRFEEINKEKYDEMIKNGDLKPY